MTPKRWVRRQVDEARAAALSKTLHLSPHVARALVARGVVETESAQRFLEPSLTQLPDPFSMNDLVGAAERLREAIIKGQRIALYADYDVDGVTSASLLASFLKKHGVEPRIYIPKRLTEGYGLNSGAVEKLAEEGVELLVTLDCGITAADEIAKAADLGIETIVVDHHKCPERLPKAAFVLNPERPDSTYPERGLCGAGVCFNLLLGLRRILREAGHYEGSQQPNMKRELDLVALGTIADVVPLVGVNRVLVAHGLEELRAARRPGIRALIEVSKTNPSRLTARDVAFRLAPRVNAAGRLDDASVGVRMLLAEDVKEARPHAATLDLANEDRRRIEGSVLASAMEMLEAEDEIPPAIVLSEPDWHPGVIGIVASRLVERYDRPTILIGRDGKGSGRTAQDVNLYELIAAASEHLSKFGGHRAAAGLTVEPDRIEPFRQAILELMRTRFAPEKAESEVLFDAELSEAELTDDLFGQFDKLAPFGQGNPEPTFAIKGAPVRSAELIKGKHLKLKLSEGRLEAMAFGRPELIEGLESGSSVDLVFHVEKSTFSGLEYYGLRIRALKSGGSS